MNFDLENITLVTLVGYFEDLRAQNPRHIQIPIHPQVQAELRTMLRTTAQKMQLPASARHLPVFSPAEKYSSEEPLKLSLATDYVSDLAAVIALQNLPSDANALNVISELEYYYAVFTDNQNRKLFAFRRASQFKGVARSKLAFLNGGVLTLMNTAVFRLDNDFDYLVDDHTIFILRPSGFEFTTNVHGQVLREAATNAAVIAASVAFLDIARISAYATQHPRAARLLAAIRARDDLHLIDKRLLQSACRIFGIAVVKGQAGSIGPDAGHEYDFLCIIDRRAYTAKLIPNQPEKYEAASRVQK
jgi:hypothetical protein